MKLQFVLSKTRSGEMQIAGVHKKASGRYASSYDSLADMRNALSKIGYGYDVISQSLIAMLRNGSGIRAILPEIETNAEILRANGFTAGVSG